MHRDKRWLQRCQKMQNDHKLWQSDYKESKQIHRDTMWQKKDTKQIHRDRDRKWLQSDAFWNQRNKKQPEVSVRVTVTLCYSKLTSVYCVFSSSSLLCSLRPAVYQRATRAADSKEAVFSFWRSLRHTHTHTRLISYLTVASQIYCYSVLHSRWVFVCVRNSRFTFLSPMDP